MKIFLIVPSSMKFSNTVLENDTQDLCFFLLWQIEADNIQ